MDADSITFVNGSGSTITLVFDESNAIEDERRVVLRIPTSFSNPARGDTASVITIESHKNAYKNLAIFLSRVEQVGKSQIRQWLQNSTDIITLPEPDVNNLWSITVE